MYSAAILAFSDLRSMECVLLLMHHTPSSSFASQVAVGLKLIQLTMLMSVRELCIG